MQITAGELAKLVNGKLDGNPDVIIYGPSRIEEGEEGTISFLANDKYEPYIYSSKASAFLVDRSFVPSETIEATLIRVDDVYSTITQLLEKFGNKQEKPASISDAAIISSSAKIGNNVSVGHYTIVEQDAIIGEGSVIHPQVFIGSNVKIGKGVVLFPGVKIMHESIIGDHCIIQSNSVIGADGFGYLPEENGYKKIPQLGNVILEDHVEIGSNCVIDRAVMGSTILREGAKLDNLIQIGHNVEVGKHTILCAQVGIAGSSKIGEWSQLGGQVGVAGHFEIAARTKVRAKSGIGKSIKKTDLLIGGNPAMELGKFNRSYVVFRNLPALQKRIDDIENKLNKDHSK